MQKLRKRTRQGWTFLPSTRESIGMSKDNSPQTNTAFGSHHDQMIRMTGFLSKVRDLSSRHGGGLTRSPRRNLAQELLKVSLHAYHRVSIPDETRRARRTDPGQRIMHIPCHKSNFESLVSRGSLVHVRFCRVDEMVTRTWSCGT